MSAGSFRETAAANGGQTLNRSGHGSVVSVLFSFSLRILTSDRYFARRMLCLTFLLKTLLMVSCYVTYVCCVEVAKPSDAQVKYLDLEIGASIHFNMQTFDGGMKPGKMKQSRSMRTKAYEILFSAKHSVQ